MLTGKEIWEAGILINAKEENIQPQGVDVRVYNICSVLGNCPGLVPEHGKTLSPVICKHLTVNCDVTNTQYWFLSPGYYELTLIEGCNLPNDICLQFKTRSSLVRCGCNIFSGLFDAGFHTDRMGCFMRVDIPVKIEVGARVAQVICDRTNAVAETYNGQFQNDIQRDELQKI